MIELKALTGLRAVAAFWVLFFHSGFSELPHMPAFAKAIFSNGHAAVSLFFVLSGFILTYNYLPRDLSTQTFKTPDRYIIARFARIYPVYIFAFLLAALTQGPLLVPTNQPLPPFWVNVVTLFGLQNWTFAEAWINHPSWSISCELFFYVTLPVLFFFLSKIKPRVSIVLFVLAVALATTVGIFSPIDFLPPIVYYPEFLTGVILGYMFRQSQVPAILQSNADMVATLGVILTIAMVVALSKKGPFLNAGGLTFPFAVTILGLAESDGLMGRMLSTKPALILGDASYSLYILQFPIKFLMADIWIMRYGDVYKPVWYRGVTMFLLIGFAVLINKTLENPARRAIMRYAKARGAPIRPTSASTSVTGE